MSPVACRVIAGSMMRTWVGERAADGSDFLFALGRVDRHQTGGFGQSVAFADGHACCGSIFIEFERAARATERQTQAEISALYRPLTEPTWPSGTVILR
jgi:hypothetical protein